MSKMADRIEKILFILLYIIYLSVPSSRSSFTTDKYEDLMVFIIWYGILNT